MAFAQWFSRPGRLSAVALRVRKLRAFHATTAGLVLLMALLASPVLREPVKSLDLDHAPEAGEEQGRAGAGSADFVRIGMRIRTLGPLDTSAQTFAAAFDLWLVGSHPLDPTGLVFSNAETPVKLGELAATRSLDGQQYRLYRAQGAFRYRPSAADVANGRLRLNISLVNEASTADQVIILPDKEASTLLPVGLDEGPTTADGAWVVSKAALARRTVALPTLGDPFFPGASSSHSALVADFVLSQASPDLGQLMQKLAPPRLAAPVWLAMLVLLAFVPLLGRYHPRPGPWRMLTVVLALGLLLAAMQAVFATYLASDLRPAIVQMIIDAFMAAWILLAAISLLGLLPTLAWEPLQRQTGAPVSALERTVVNVVIVLALVIYFLFEALHMSAASVFAASGVLTVVLGIALQNIILDLFSGILLNLEKPFRLLDWVTVATGGSPVHGQVRNMNWRTTQLQTRDNDMVSIPNSVMAKATVNNHAMPANATRYKLDFVVDAKTDTHVVRRVMREAALRATDTGLVLSKPPPSVVVQDVKDYGVRYCVMFYLNLNMASDSQAVNVVAENVLTALSEASIDLAFREIAETPHAAGGPPPAKPGAAGKATAPSSEGDAILSPEDLAHIKTSWSLVAPLGEKVAILFYDRLFESEPQLRPLFRTDRKTQRTKLLAMLSLLVKGLDHPEHVVEVLTDLGRRHLSYGVKRADYDAVGAALLWALEQGLGPSFDPPTRAAWTRLYGVMAVVMVGDSSGMAA